MKIKLHSSAKKDLIEGFHFYEKQQQSIGQYFLDSLYSDLESLSITAGIHLTVYKTYFRMRYQNGFLLPFTTLKTLKLLM